MAKTDVVASVRKKYERLALVMDERVRRLWAGAEAEELGRGGIAIVEQATGMSRTTVRAGRDELRRGALGDSVVAIRRAGAGRPRLEDSQPELRRKLEMLVGPSTRGDPQSPLQWTATSTRELSRALAKQGLQASPQKVAVLLHQQGYSLQSARKTIEGKQHPDRNAQFEFINERVRAYQRRGQPVISVDTKKKELIGDFKNAGKEWRPKGKPERVRVHDFVDPALGKAIPYGVYDIAKDEAWVSVGTDHDTADFAVESIWQWWTRMGRKAYPDATELLITADGGGSNSYRTKLWKMALQKLADRTGLQIGVSHFPPGTSKWNKIEHRLFCHITENWRGRPLVDHETIVQLIAATRTSKGLKVKAAIDKRTYPTGIEVPDEELRKLRLKPGRFHGEWNYSIAPTSIHK